MSRYVIWTEDDNLEVFVGFDEGFEKFFLTIADTRTWDATGKESYLFHNIDDQAGVGMTISQVAATLSRFGIGIPMELEEQLERDAREACPDTNRAATSASHSRLLPDTAPVANKPIRVTGWQNAL